MTYKKYYIIWRVDVVMNSSVNYSRGSIETKNKKKENNHNLLSFYKKKKINSEWTKNPGIRWDLKIGVK